MPPILTESNIEEGALEILSELGYNILHGLDIAPDGINPHNNEFLAVNQFTVLENNNNRRPDIILFINGLPLVCRV
jgi:hypothetical protein